MVPRLVLAPPGTQPVLCWFASVLVLLLQDRQRVLVHQSCLFLLLRILILVLLVVLVLVAQIREDARVPGAAVVRLARARESRAARASLAGCAPFSLQALTGPPAGGLTSCPMVGADTVVLPVGQFRLIWRGMVYVGGVTHVIIVAAQSS